MRAKRSRQDGNVLIAVMVAMVVLMTMGAGMVNYFVYGEADAVERSLAEYRAYWAMMGTVNYMLSRAEGQGVCYTSSGIDTKSTFDNNKTGACSESARIEFLTDNIDASPILPSTWTFPLSDSVGSNYNFQLQYVITARSTAPTPVPGQFQIDFMVTNPGDVPILKYLTDRSQGLRIGFCITDHTSDCATKIAVTAGSNDDNEGRSRIQFIRRLPPS